MTTSPLVIVTLPVRDVSCQLTHFTTVIHARLRDQVLVDYPVGLDRRERRWIPAALTTAV